MFSKVRSAGKSVKGNLSESEAFGLFKILCVIIAFIFLPPIISGALFGLLVFLYFIYKLSDY